HHSHLHSFPTRRSSDLTAGMFAQHQTVAGHTHGFRNHNLVTKRIVDYTVLVNAGLVGKGVAANDRLVGLHLGSNDGRKQLAGWIDRKSTRLNSSHVAIS